MTIDQKALEAAKDAFYGGPGEGFKNPPIGALETAITAYLAALHASDHTGLRETMWGEVVFEGEDNAFLWKLDEEGNRDGEHYERSIELSADTFPVGTKLVICEPDEEAATALSAASPAPLEGVRVDRAAINQALDVLSIVILAGTSISEAYDGTPTSTRTKLAEYAEAAWRSLSAIVGSAK